MSAAEQSPETTHTQYDAVDDFAGPGGWDEGVRMLGLKTIGYEWDEMACRTAEAAGHARVQADVSLADASVHRGVKGYIGSPSCTLFSAAGSGVGNLVTDVLADGIRRLFAGEDCRVEVREAIYPVTLAEAEEKNAKRAEAIRWTAEQVEAKARSDAFVASLVLEPARRILELDPEWIALEQVPAVLPLWEVYVHCLRQRGYSAWTRVLCAADYGVPQTRMRAVVGASRVRHTVPPAPTHSEHVHEADIFGTSLLPWVSMAEALTDFGWTDDDHLRHPRGAGMIERHGPRDDRRADEPAMAVTSKCRSWVLDRRTNSKGAGGTMVATPPVSINRPAPTLTGKGVGSQLVLRMSNNANAAIRPVDQPAPTILFGHSSNDVRWYPEGTTQRGVPELAAERHEDSRLIAIPEAGVLQSFRPDYPWQGSRTKQGEQVGNAVPPLMAAHIVASVTGLGLALPPGQRP